MVTVTVSSQYTVQIPEHFRSKLHVGQKVAISVDDHGRLILTPIEQAHEILDETFGMWADRTDIPKGGIKYMDKIRRGHRLKDLGIRKK
jgi:bifunctional DNA-binding transcriptional regulator/antitoxin component of YhaV-PrlF toxin-antitoxin module